MFDLLQISGPLRVRRWWFILPGYLALWSLTNGIWTFVDGQGLFDAFGIDITVATDGDEFVLANSGARYLGIAAALIVGIFVLDSAAAAITALTARLVMDVGDVVAGLRTDQFDNVAVGLAQSAAMFVVPSVVSIAWLIRATRAASAGSAADGGQLHGGERAV